MSISSYIKIVLSAWILAILLLLPMSKAFGAYIDLGHVELSSEESRDVVEQPSNVSVGATVTAEDESLLEKIVEMVIKVLE